MLPVSWARSNFLFPLSSQALNFMRKSCSNINIPSCGRTRKVYFHQIFEAVASKKIFCKYKKKYLELVVYLKN